MQHRIFDLIEHSNFKDEDSVESSYDNEREVLESSKAALYPETITIKSATEENEQVKELSKQMRHSEESEKYVNCSHTNDFVSSKVGLISVVMHSSSSFTSFSSGPFPAPF
jgi:hypothetical protein